MEHAIHESWNITTTYKIFFKNCCTLHSLQYIFNDTQFTTQPILLVSEKSVTAFIILFVPNGCEVASVTLGVVVDPKLPSCLLLAA